MISSNHSRTNRNILAGPYAFVLFIAILAIGTLATAQEDSKEVISQAIAGILQSASMSGQGMLDGGGPSMTEPRLSKTKSGYVRILGAPPSQYFPVPSAVPGDAESTARYFLQDHKAAFGIGSEVFDFVANRTQTKDGRSHVRFGQLYAGIPVFAAETLVQLNGDGGVEYVSSDIITDAELPDIEDVSMVPSITSSEAEQIAIGMMMQENIGVEMHAEPAVVMIYQPSIIGKIGPTRLVWNTTVAGGPGSFVAELVLVDAHSGEIALHYSLIRTAKNRLIYDADSSTRGILVRAEGDPPYGLLRDVDLAYDYLGDTYDFYMSHHGRDSIDDAGMDMVAFVRVCLPDDPCPWWGAGWFGDSRVMGFGEGWVADDITGHELTHGVVNCESKLVYAGESGAIDESFCDMWGEWIDQTNARGNDSASFKWLIGEDSPIGAFRNMKDPPQFDDPDRKGSPNWYRGSDDSAFVHINSGVNNKLCYLLTDGGTFRGETITGMGISRVADLYYEVQTTLLTSGADYYNLYSALRQAAFNLGWTDAQTQNLERGCQAVEIAEEDRTVVVFSDTFPAGGIDRSKWPVVHNAAVSDGGRDEPSGQYSLRLNGNPSGGDTVESRVIDLSFYSGATLTYSYEKTGYGESPDNGDDLIFSYWTGSTWKELDRQEGTIPDMEHYTQISIEFPPDAMHAGFKLQIRSIGTADDYYYQDDWFVDDVEIEAWIGSTVVFEDTFPSLHVDSTKWPYAEGASVDGDGQNPPSPPYSLHLRASNVARSLKIDMSSFSGATLSYQYQRTGAGEPPDEGDDLTFSYWNGSSYVELTRHPGSGPDMTSF
ncbi:MAG: M4 family metallopeptidase, partial [Planctomycetota bacterium]